jgi:N-acetylglutamate synthase-like GNAT family acetyltransferase
MLKIVPALVEDAAALTALAFESKGSWGYPQHWLESWRDQIEITSEFLQNNSMIKAIDENGKLLGCAGLSGKGEKLVLSGFWIKPEAMGKGIGKALYKSIMDCAREKGAKYVVWESDPNAEAFYDRMGAQKISEKKYELDNSIRVLPIMKQTL